MDPHYSAAPADGRRCCRCKIVKPIAEFFRDARAPDGVMRRCKDCHDAALRAHMIAVTCQRCGAPFEVIPTWLKFGKGKYCSPECRHAAIADVRRARCPVTCLSCGRVFACVPSKVGRTKYCSRACRDAHVVGPAHPRWKGGEEPYRDRQNAAQRMRYRAAVPVPGGAAALTTLADIAAFTDIDGLRARFMAGLDRSSPHGCWHWTRTKPGSYGRIDIVSTAHGRRGVAMSAHRLAYIFAHGAIPEGLSVLHACDVHYAAGDTSYRSCCNPDHLELGTNRDNMRHCVDVGRRRIRRGEERGGVRFTAAQVADIRARYATGETLTQLARCYETTASTVHGIVHGRSWRHVPGAISD